ncbi:MAG: flagellar hook-associated protein 3 [Spirochaetaceae bacterium]
MDRVSTSLPNDNMMYYLRQRQDEMLNMQGQIASQSRIQELRDDPIAAAHATRHNSFLSRLQRFSTNIERVKSEYQISEGYMQQAVDNLQRARELAVQGANGTYTDEDMRKMAMEVDQILNEMVEIANAQDGTGRTIFSGTRGSAPPFRAVTGVVDGEKRVITNVDYVGSIDTREAEIGEQAFIEANIPGNTVFWAEPQSIFAEVDAGGYQVSEESSIFVDGEEIRLSPGDTVEAIIAKINDSPAPVRARLDPVQNGVVIETTTPHQIWLRDGEDSTVLSDLGLITSSDAPPPQNIAPGARRFGGSTFDMLIQLRDRLMAGDQENVGGSALRGIDSALDNVLSNLGKVGARTARLESAYSRTEQEIPEQMKRVSMEQDVDLAKAISDLRRMEQTHQAALGATARIITPTLLDFLR